MVRILGNNKELIIRFDLKSLLSKAIQTADQFLLVIDDFFYFIFVIIETIISQFYLLGLLKRCI